MKEFLPSLDMYCQEKYTILEELNIFLVSTHSIEYRPSNIYKRIVTIYKLYQSVPLLKIYVLIKDFHLR